MPKPGPDDEGAPPLLPGLAGPVISRPDGDAGDDAAPGEAPGCDDAAAVASLAPEVEGCADAQGGGTGSPPVPWAGQPGLLLPPARGELGSR